MKIYRVDEQEFKEYGNVLTGYDFSKLFEALSVTKIPEQGIVYVASEEKLEQCGMKEELQNRGFGGFPIQLGYVNGRNRVLNCLEYHKSSEFNIALDDIVLVLGSEKQIENGRFDTSLAKAFLVPAGTGVELYGTTLHYAPFHVNEKGYRVCCVLPEKTNNSKTPLKEKCSEDTFCFGVNKWLLAHCEATEVQNGACIGLVGANITYDMLER